MDLQKLRKYNDFLRLTKQSGKIKECFYYDNTKCEGGIEAAHSITENGRLSLIEYEVNKQNGIFCFESPVLTNDEEIAQPRLMGKVAASIFHGFCKYHDSTLFRTIEQSEYLNNSEHNFFHSYRSFAYTFHMHKQHFMTFFTPSDVWLPEHREMMGYWRLAQTQNMLDCERRKSEINTFLENKNYDGLSYLVYQKEGLYPFACACSYIFPVLPNDSPVNKIGSIESMVHQIVITFLPGKHETSVIMAAFPNDEPAMKFLDQFDSLADKMLERAITSLLISDPNGSYFSPAFWNALNSKERKALFTEHKKFTEVGYFQKINKFFWSHFNYFDARFEGKKLGLY